MMTTTRTLRMRTAKSAWGYDAAVRAVYEAGREARRQGRFAGANPHTDYHLGTAWAAGWHHGIKMPAGLRTCVALAGLRLPREDG